MKIEQGTLLRGDKIQRFMLDIKTVAKRKGFLAAITAATNRIRRAVTSRVKLSFLYNYNKLLMSRATFLFQGNKYAYFLHTYNVTWRNERTVEIPIVKHILQGTSGDVLEIGNVLSHYFDVKHDIVDKYEQGNGVMTQDVTEMDTAKRYDLIISISTMEHVGWDEKPDHSALVDDPEKILKAISKLCSLLKPKGKIVITVPLGYSPHLDNLLESGRLKFDEMFFMKRAPGGRRWVEAAWAEVKDVGFNMQVPTANALLIGYLKN